MPSTRGWPGTRCDAGRSTNRQWGQGLLRQTGALWLLGSDASFGDTSAATLQEDGIALDEISLPDATRRYPQMSFDGVSRVLFEPSAGYLFASRACEHVGGAGRRGRRHRIVTRRRHRRSSSTTAPSRSATAQPSRRTVSCSRADRGSGTLFPDVVGRLVTPTRQEVYYFGLPPGDARFHPPALPVWLECAERFVYGIPTDDGGGLQGGGRHAGPGHGSDQ